MLLACLADPLLDAWVNREQVSRLIGRLLEQRNAGDALALWPLASFACWQRRLAF